MPTQENKAVVRRIFDEAWSHGKLEVIDEISMPDSISHVTARPEPLRGPGEVKEFFSAYRSAFPDLEMTVEDQIAEGDKVVTRWTARGTHEGDFMGIEATGKTTAVAGMTVHRLADGKIAEAWAHWDTMGLMQQLGVIPELARA